MKKMIFLLFCFSLCALSAQESFDEVQIEAQAVTDDIYVLYGRGGNIGLAVAQDYAYLIDDQYRELSEKIIQAVREITDKPIRFVINTHWHVDHTNGNENMAQHGAIIIAHESVRKRMSGYQERSGGRIVPPQPFMALPRITFTDELTIHLDSLRKMHIMHVEHAHTDGDAFVYFPQNNVIHLGDNFPNGGYPYIDMNSNGDIEGFIKNLNLALLITDEDTRIIPGHGKVTNRQVLREYRDMLVTLRLRVKKAKATGKTLEEVQQMGLSAEWDGAFGKGFIKPDQVVAAIYQTVD